MQTFKYFVDNFCFYLSPMHVPVGVEVLCKFEYLLILETLGWAWGFYLKRVGGVVSVESASESQFLEILQFAILNMLKMIGLTLWD